ncbi:g3011 [Coccomyxa elongata]
MVQDVNCYDENGSRGVSVDEEASVSPNCYCNGVKINGHSTPEGKRMLRKKLKWFDELPRVLQYNKYVRSKYRAGYTYSECACSIFQYHNETGNIHTHLLPALAVLVLLSFRLLQPWPLAKLAFYEHIGAIVLCLGGSVAYHTLMAHHQDYHRWLLMDVCGVFALLLSGVHTWMYWGLYCHPWLRSSFIAAYYIAAAGCVVAGLRACTQMQRAAPMLALLGVRLGSLVTRTILNSGSQDAVWHYAVTEVLSFAGAVINVLRIPEKWFHDQEAADKGVRKANPFDCWLNSHQLMHGLVALAMLHLHWGAADDYYFFVSHPGQCSSAH